MGTARLASTIVLVLLTAACSGGGLETNDAGGNKAPIADAGASRIVDVPTPVVLDGSASRDPEARELTFAWSFDSIPAGSNAVLVGSATVAPAFTADVAGSFVLRLVVNDGSKDSAPAFVTITADAAADLRVGPGRTLETPSEAARVAKDGDTIAIDAGLYEGDVAVWRQSGLTIRGAGGFAHLAAAGASAERKAIWVVKGSNTTIESIEFSGARVKDKNGAGIRQEGVGLTLRDCWFHDNENGILAGNNATSDIVIERCEFARNGHGDGQSHNLYVNYVRSLTIRFTWSHHAKIGHNIKSRARTNHLAYNRIMDESDGTASYSVDLPNGGIAFLIGNEIQQGPRTDNSTLVSFGAEGYKHAANELYLSNNTLVNDRHTGTFVRARSGATVVLRNNIFAGRGSVLAGQGQLFTNLVTNAPGFVDRAGYDYRLAAASPAIDGGSAPGSARGVSLIPLFEYRHRASQAARASIGGLDIGARERTD